MCFRCKGVGPAASGPAKIGIHDVAQAGRYESTPEKLTRLTFAGLSLAVLCGCAAGASKQPIDDSDLVVLHHNVHAQARSELQVGHTAPATMMERMIFVLKLDAVKQVQLDALLARQQDPASSDFHRWLTPQEFGSQFGRSPEEIAQVAEWLSLHGFAVDEVGAGGTWINFSGAVSDVEAAFHTTIDDFDIDGELRHANSIDPSIPRALSGTVAGIVSLHNIPRRAMNTGVRQIETDGIQVDFTGASGSHYVSPGDFAVIYNVNALYDAGIDGTGQTVAIVGRTHPAASNWSTFRSTMALPANAPVVVVNGTDPGDQGANEDGEADLDVEWSGAVAKGATIRFVTSKSTASTDGVDLSAQYIINNNLAPVMSTSFGLCESSLGSSGNAFYNSLWSQAASQGITSFVSSGDSGSAGCNRGNDTTGSGQAVSGLASTPYNVAVGGTQFNEGTGTYWSSTNSAGDKSALSYIPEMVWNESSNVSGGSGLWATGGGASSIYFKPPWQVAPGVPTDGKRDIPDVSLSAAIHDGYLVYTQGALIAIGGTSASSPSFAGLMALIVQKTGARQGSATTRFYQLAQTQYGSGGAAVFRDTTTGTNGVRGVTGFAAANGYDEATGLGSVDATALANAWAPVNPNPDFAIWASPTMISAQQGALGTTTLTTTVSAGFSNAIAFTTSGLPTGATATFGPPSIASPGSGTSSLTLSAGSGTPTGAYSVTVAGTGGSTTHTASIRFTVSATSTACDVFSDGIESVTGWMVYGATGTTARWVQVTSGISPVASAHGGSYFAEFNSFSAASGHQARLYRATGFLVPNSCTTMTLSYWVFHDIAFSASNDRVQAQVSTNGSTWTDVGSPVYRNDGTSGWARVSVDLSGLGGQTVQLGFFGTSAFGNDIYLDDIVVGASAGSTHSISGTITTSGSGLSGVTVSAGATTTTTAADGSYTIAGLANGSYAITPSLSKFTFSPTSRSATVSGANVTGVSFTASALPTSWSISGTVTLVGSGVAGVTVSAGIAWATTAADGTYTIAGLTNGSYTITPSLSGYTLAPASRLVTVSGDNVTEVSFTASAAPSTWSISGTVTLGDSGVAGVTVSAGDASATTGGDGAYTIAGLTSGSHTIVPALAGYTFTPTNRSATVSSANVTDVSFTGTAAASTWSISGTIAFGNSGLPGVTVSAGAGEPTATTARDGSYTIAGLANGTHAVTPFLPGFAFSPASLSTTVSGANVTGVSFTATAVPSAKNSDAGPDDGVETTGEASTGCGGCASGRYSAPFAILGVALLRRRRSTSWRRRRRCSGPEPRGAARCCASCHC